VDDDWVADDSVADDAGKQEHVSAEKEKGENLEQLLLARNKKLSNELTVLRVSHQDLQTRLAQLQENMSVTNMELEKSRNLTATLENDLTKVQQEAANAFDTMSVAGTRTSRHPRSTYGTQRGRNISPTSSIISGMEGPRYATETTLEAAALGQPVGGGSGMLPMIIAQRDRFKKSNADLSEQLSKEHDIVQSLRNEIASLQKDNLNLYEKSRYISTFNRGGPTSNSLGTGLAHNPNSSVVQVDAATPSLDQRYASRYESSLTPFASFRSKESQRAVRRMSYPERVVYQLTRIVLQTRTSRNLFAGYVLALHVLIFLMLYWIGDADEAGKYTASMAETIPVGGGIGAVGPAALGVGEEPPADGG